MDTLVATSGTKTASYTYILFKQVGTYLNEKGEESEALEAVRPLMAYEALPALKNILADSSSKWVIKVSRPEENHFENLVDVFQRRQNLEILRHLTSYTNAREVREADEFYPLEGQLKFPWKKLVANYKWILSDDEKENASRLALIELLNNYRSGNRHLMVQEYLDKASDGFTPSMMAASDHLRLFEAQGFIELTDYFTIVPKKVKEFYDTHFESKDKDGKW